MSGRESIEKREMITAQQLAADCLVDPYGTPERIERALREAKDEATMQLRAELAAAQAVVVSLSARVAAQSELLAAKAEWRTQPALAGE